MRSSLAVVGMLLTFVCSAQLSAVSFSSSQGNANVYLSEGFDGGTLPAGWNVQLLSGVTAMWSVVGSGTNPPVAPYTGTGQLKFNSYDAPAGEQARLVSPPVDLAAASDPFLEFFMYHDDAYPSEKDSLVVEVTTGDAATGPWTPLEAFQRPRAVRAWLGEAVSLRLVRGASRVLVGLRGVSKYGNNLFVDDVRILDTLFHDLGVVSVLDESAGGGGSFSSRAGVPMTMARNRLKVNPAGMEQLLPSAVQARLPLSIKAVVKNFGTFAESSYVVKWSVDDKVQQPVSNARSLDRGGTDTLQLPWLAPSSGLHVISAWPSLAADSNQRNDTARVTVQVLDTTVAFFESFNSENFLPEGWSVVNRDGGIEPAWFRGSSVSAFPPYEGPGFAADNFQRSNGSYLDDYLISPPLAGVGHALYSDSLVFYARSAFYDPPATNYPDSLMILISTSGADTTSFVNVLDFFEVPKGVWSRRAYRLTGAVAPNSTVRIAFRYLLYNAGPDGPSGDFVGVDAVQWTRSGLTSVPQDPGVPDQFALHQNYPNPFNPVTLIRFDIPGDRDHQPASGLAGWSGVSGVKLVVYDLLGCEIAVLMNEKKAAGSYEVRFDGSRLASGVYVCRLEAGSLVQSRKMVLLK